MIQTRSWRQLIDLEDGTVSRDVFVDDEIYRMEQEQIFARAWLFVGHETQVPKPGDYFQSRMGEESVLLVRDRQNQIHVFLNTCRHRGMKVCRYDEGNTLLFTCPFHGWSYDTDGALVGVPSFQSAYHGELEKDRWGLIEVAQMANFQGSIWATWDPKAPSFDDYLGDYAEMAAYPFEGDDGRPNGKEVVGVQKWRMPSNWKFPAMSANGDAAHGSMTHLSVGVAAIGPQGEEGGGDRHGMPTLRERWEISMPEVGHGTHISVHDTDEMYTETWHTMPQIEGYFRDAYETRMQRLNAAGKKRIDGGGPVFPNFSSGGAPDAAVVWHPHSTGVTECWRFYFVDRQAPKEVRDAIRWWQMRYAGPCGTTDSDDMENWNYASAASRGTIARRHPYNYQMGMGRERDHNSLPGKVSPVRSEHLQRARMGRWREFMEAASWDEIYPRRK